MDNFNDALPDLDLVPPVPAPGPAVPTDVPPTIPYHLIVYNDVGCLTDLEYDPFADEDNRPRIVRIGEFYRVLDEYGNFVAPPNASQKSECIHYEFGNLKEIYAFLWHKIANRMHEEEYNA